MYSAVQPCNIDVSNFYYKLDLRYRDLSGDIGNHSSFSFFITVSQGLIYRSWQHGRCSRATPPYARRKRKAPGR